MFTRLLFFILTSAASFSAISSHPFQFETRPEVEEVQPVPAVLPTNLSEEQKAQVLGLIENAVAKVTQLIAGQSVANVDGEMVVILQESQVYVGVSSGMHVIYDNESLEFSYYDSREYRRVIPKNQVSTIATQSVQSDVERTMQSGVNDRAPVQVKPRELR